jgi:acetyl esterase/lipase
VRQKLGTTERTLTRATGNFRSQGGSLETLSTGEITAEPTIVYDADQSRTILYLHGGIHVIGSLDSHRHLAVGIVRAARRPTLAVGYRIAPEHPFAAMDGDTVAAYQYLVD